MESERIDKLGYIEKGGGGHQSNTVISQNGIAPTICSGCGVKYWINFVEVRRWSKETGTWEILKPS